MVHDPNIFVENAASACSAFESLESDQRNSIGKKAAFDKHQPAFPLRN